MRHLFLITLLLVSCGQEEQKPKRTGEVATLEELNAQRDLYNEKAKELQGELGFIDPDDCDTALYNALLLVGGLEGIDLFALMRGPGRWFRRPSQDCYDKGESKSDISPDMFAGIGWGLWFLDEKDAIADILRYGRKNFWVMGRGVLSRTVMRPSMQRTLAMIANEQLPSAPDLWFTPDKDYSMHVVALNIILRGEFRGFLPEGAYKVLKKLTSKDPRNALFQYGVARFSDGDFGTVVEILSDLVRFPLDRLPTSSDRCVRWLWERSSNTEHWQPCLDGKTHSGGDFTFMVYLLNRAADNNIQYPTVYQEGVRYAKSWNR